VEISLQAQGKSVPLAVEGPCSVFDLRSLVCGVMPCVDVVCREECRITRVPREEFDRLLKLNPRAYFAVAKVLSADLKTANDALRRLLSSPPRGFRRVKPIALPPEVQPH
jgi:CRP-like cAMP-binding protein